MPKRPWKLQKSSILRGECVNLLVESILCDPKTAWCVRVSVGSMKHTSAFRCYLSFIHKEHPLWRFGNQWFYISRAFLHRESCVLFFVLFFFLLLLRFISYPRTETNIFPANLALTPLVEQQAHSPVWGAFAQRVLDQPGGPNPRQGKNSDQAHPPIHPTKFTNTLQVAWCDQ